MGSDLRLGASLLGEGTSQYVVKKKKKMNSCLILSCKKKRGLDSTLTLVVNQIFIDIFLNDFVVD